MLLKPELIWFLPVAKLTQSHSPYNFMNALEKVPQFLLLYFSLHCHVVTSATNDGLEKATLGPAGSSLNCSRVSYCSARRDCLASRVSDLDALPAHSEISTKEQFRRWRLDAA